MRGFQPRSAAGAKERRFADGGFVQGIKRAFGMDEERNAQIAAYRARAAAEKAQQQAQAQQQTPQPQQRAVTQYSGMSATQRREKELGLADGGRVRPRGFVAGKGTATSDSIPARLSNGEYVLPADTVRAVGVEALDALRESTHQPVKGERAHAARGFFAGGTPGGVGTWFQDQENARAKRAPGAVPGAPALGAYAPGTRGAQLVAAEEQKAKDRAATGMAIVDAIKAPFGKGSAPATPSLTAPAAPQAPSTPNANDVRLAAGTVASPGAMAAARGSATPPKPAAAPVSMTGAPPAAAPSSAPVAAGFMPGTRAVFNESGKAIGDLAKQGRYGAAAGETARAALTYVPAVADDLIGGAVRAVGPGIVDAGRQFLGMNDGAAAAITNPTDARLAAGTRRAPSGFAPAIKPQATATPTVPQQAPVTAPVQRMAQQPQAPAFDFDNFQPAPGQGAFRNEQTGEVTRLQDGPSPTRDTRIWKEPNVLPRSDARPASPRQDVRAPVLNPNGGVFSSMVDFTNQAGQAVQAIAANKGMRNDRKDALDQQRVGLDAASTFAKIEQGDRALGIDGRRADTAQDLAALQADELGLKREAAGFQTRAEQRRESAYDNYSKAKTDEDRQAIAKQFPDLFDRAKDAAHRMEVVRGKTDPMTGQSSGDYVVVQDPKTGEVRQIQMGAAPAPQALPPKDQLKAGQTYSTPRGQARWDGNQFIPV